MNILQKIKIVWSTKTAVEELVKEAKMESASGKSGWKTTEFWMDAATKAAVLWGAVQGFIPPKWAAIIAAAGTAVYGIGRVVSKAVSDIQAARVAAPAAGAVTEVATATASVKPA